MAFFKTARFTPHFCLDDREGEEEGAQSGAQPAIVNRYYPVKRNFMHSAHLATTCKMAATKALKRIDFDEGREQKQKWLKTYVKDDAGLKQKNGLRGPVQLMQGP